MMLIFFFLPDEILNALSAGKINEGHTRPLMMLQDRPEEQMVLFKEILYKKITVREAERMARKIAIEKVRKTELLPDPEILEMEELFQEALGTRVHIEKNEKGGQILIDFFSPDDLRTLLDSLNKSGASINNPNALLERHDEKVKAMAPEETTVSSEEVEALDDRSEEEKDKDDDTDLYNIKNFSL